MKHIFLIVGRHHYGEKLCQTLDGDQYFAEVISADALDCKHLSADDIIILDAHAVPPKGLCNAVYLVRALREQGVGTPFIILTWLSYKRVILPLQATSNPFISNYYQDSCRFLPLPVSPADLASAIREVRACTEEETNLGKRFLTEIGKAHVRT